MSELIHCPFCGNTDDVQMLVSDMASCGDCLAGGPVNDPDGTKWNTRPEPPEVQQLRERVRVLEAALTNIKRHYETIAGPNLQYSAVWHIATAAFDAAKEPNNA